MMLTNLGRRPSDIFAGWLNMVCLFTASNLTFSKDRLPAMAGLAAAMQRFTSATYLHGLWSDDLPRSLLWEIRKEVSNPKRRCPYVPSWSWASITGWTINSYSMGWEFLIEVQMYSQAAPNSNCLFGANDMGILLAGSFADGQFDIRSYNRGGPVFSSMMFPAFATRFRVA